MNDPISSVSAVVDAPPQLLAVAILARAARHAAEGHSGIASNLVSRATDAYVSAAMDLEFDGTVSDTKLRSSYSVLRPFLNRLELHGDAMSNEALSEAFVAAAVALGARLPS